MSLTTESGAFTRQQGDALVELVLSGLDLTAAKLAATINARFPNRPRLMAIDIVMELGRRGIALPGTVPPAGEAAAARPLSPEARERFETETARREATALRALSVIDNTVFTPANRSELEWGAEALRYWSDPDIGPWEVGQLLRPGHVRRPDYGFYLQLDDGPDGSSGRVISAWEAWLDERIDIIELCKRARHYFHRCNLSDDELATSWQKRIMAEVRANNWDAEQLRDAMPKRANGSPWSLHTVRNLLADPTCSISSSLHHAVDRGLMKLRASQGFAAKGVAA